MLAIASGARAQAAIADSPEPAMASVDSLAAEGDSAAALAALQSFLQDNPLNAAAWHRRGELALRLARPEGAGFKWNAQTIRLMRIADSATARAVYLAPDSGRYQLTRAMYFLAGELPMVREGAGAAYRRGLSAAQRSQDSAVIAELATELGLWYWRTYDGLAHRRRIGLDAPLRELVERAESRRDLDHLVESYFPQADPKSGEVGYLRSSEFFLIALRARPDDARAWVFSYMSLLALEAWEELESAASVRLSGEPDDAWAWMTMGMPCTGPARPSRQRDHSIEP
jgi:tetratricopeptide (TPR) repeat protein